MGEELLDDEEEAPRWRSELRCWQPGGMWRIGVAVLIAFAGPDGVPARDTLVEDGLVGDTDPPLLERCDDESPPSLVGETEDAVDDGMTT